MPSPLASLPSFFSTNNKDPPRPRGKAAFPPDAVIETASGQLALAWPHTGRGLEQGQPAWGGWAALVQRHSSLVLAVLSDW